MTTNNSVISRWTVKGKHVRFSCRALEEFVLKLITRGRSFFMYVEDDAAAWSIMVKTDQFIRQCVDTQNVSWVVRWTEQEGVTRRLEMNNDLLDSFAEIIDIPY